MLRGISGMALAFFLDALGVSSSKQEKLKVLFRIFMNNPKILYAPANTTADLIIKKVRCHFSQMYPRCNCIAFRRTRHSSYWTRLRTMRSRS